jgi:hypothetical protein
VSFLLLADTSNDLQTATWSLVGVTGGLVMATLVMAVSTWKSTGATAEAAQAAVRAAKAAEEDLKQGQELIRIGQTQNKAMQDQVVATLEELEITRQSLRSSVQPWLRVGTGVPGETDNSLTPPLHIPAKPALRLAKTADGHLLVDLQVQNVGPGLAIIDPFESYVVGWPAKRVSTQRQCATRAHKSIIRL